MSFTKNLSKQEMATIIVALTYFQDKLLSTDIEKIKSDAADFFDKVDPMSPAQIDQFVFKLIDALNDNSTDRPLNELQLMVAQQYDGGEFGFVKTVEEAKEQKDGLFTFLIVEAGDAQGDTKEFVDLVNSADRQLRSLSDELEEHLGLESKGMSAQ